MEEFFGGVFFWCFKNIEVEFYILGIILRQQFELAKLECKITFSQLFKPSSYRILILNFFGLFLIDKTKPMSSVTNANTSGTQAAPIAVTAPAVSSGQATPTSPIKKVR